MPDMNEHMDELMRKAAAEYPLRITGNDWEKIAAQIHPEKDRRRPWLWIFLPVAIGIAFLAWFIFRQSPVNGDETAKVNKVAISNKNLVQSPVNADNVSLEKGSAKDPAEMNDPSQPIANSSSRQVSNIFDGKNFIDDSRPGKRGKRNINGQSSIVITQGSLAGQGEKENQEEVPGSAGIASSDLPVAQEENNEEVNRIDEPIVERSNAMPVVIKYIPAEDADEPADDKNRKGQARFYAGISGGLDVSSVKLQGFDRTGKNFGIIAGIELNDRWAIEAGVNMNRKYYSTDGKYLKGYYPLPYYATIESASGDCDMLDFPITARYTFNPSKKLRYTVNAGFSSYLMQEESYTYNVNHNGNRYPKNMEYNNTEFTPFAVFTTGAGVALSLNKFSIGAEPYFRLPLRKMGTGNLPLQSAGLNLRITRSF